MITRNEIDRLATAHGVDPPVIDHDYVLGCFLHYLNLHPEVQRSLIFKGGTSLQKCHFAAYRFSEDLDFTASALLSAAQLRQIIDAAKNAMQIATGIRADKQQTSVAIIADDYGQESYEAKVYYEGPLIYGGTHRSLRIHVSRGEPVLFPPKMLPLRHNYSDQKDLPETRIRVYALEEILAEKLRAFSGQRKWAVARDVYDLNMLAAGEVDVEAAFTAFPAKCAAKGISHTAIEIAKILQRRTEYERNWQNSLQYLIPTNSNVPFEKAWNTAIALLQHACKD